MFVKLRNTAAILLLAAGAATAAAAEPPWQPTNGPYGGTVTSLALTPSGIVFAATLEGGLFRASGGDEPWLPIARELPPAWSVTFDSTTSTLYLGTQAGLFTSADLGASWREAIPQSVVISLRKNSAGHIFALTGDPAFMRSTDGGETWTGLELPVDNYDGPSAIAIDALDRLYVGTSFGRFFTSDTDGDTWTEHTGRWPPATIFTIEMGQADDVYFGAAGSGVFRSRNRGTDWIHAGLVNVMPTQIVVDGAGQVYCATNSNGLYRSASGTGVDWERLDLSVEDPGVFALVLGRDGRMYAGMVGTGVVTTNDGGIHWAPYNDGLAAVQCWGFLATRAGSVLAYSYWSGVLRTDDGGAAWSPSGLVAESPLCLLEAPSGTLFCGTAFGLYRSADGGLAWTRVGADYDGVTALAQLRSGALLAAVPYTAQRRSIDGGANWEPWGQTPGDSPVRSLAVLPGGTVLAATFNSGVFASDDEGEHWQPRGLAGVLLYDMAVASTGRAFVAAADGTRYSDDAGLQWQPVALPQGTGVVTVMVDSTDQVWAATTQGVLVSADGGVNWVTAGDGLPDGMIIALDRGPHGDIYAQGRAGPVYRYSPQTPVEFADLQAVLAGGDVVLRWQWRAGGPAVRFEVSRRCAGTATDAPDFAPVPAAVERASENEYVCRDRAPTAGRYRYRVAALAGPGETVQAPVLEIDVDVAPGASTARFVSCSPNPFNPATTLVVTTGGGQAADIAVVDARGRLVRSLWRSAPVRSGEYRIPWDGRDEAGRRAGSGIYWARLRVDGRTRDSRALVLVR